MNRLVRWDPFAVRVDSAAVEALIRARMPAATMSFEDGFIAVAAGPLRARVTVVAISANELHLAIFVNGSAPAIDVKVVLAALLPPFVDVTIAGAEITSAGLVISLGPGGADPPQ